MAVSLHSLPVFVRLEGRSVMLIGDGEAALAKRRLLERAGAAIVGENAEAALAIVALDEPDATVAQLKARGVLVNAVDRPDLCDFTLPAIVDRSPVIVAVGTGGVSAGLAAALRQRLETMLPAGLGELAQTLQGLRQQMPDSRERRQAIGDALDDLLGAYSRESGDPESQAERPATLGSRRRGSTERISLTSPDPDELTLRQARALAQADRVIHAPNVPSAILDRARADAPRIVSLAPPVEPSEGLTIFLEMGRMSGFAYHVDDAGKATECEIKQALDIDNGFVWVHLSTNNEHAQQWLTDVAQLDDYLVEALTAAETRPRCEQFGDGALLNLRGRADDKAVEVVDHLASVRIWAVAGRVISVTRRALVAVGTVKACVEAGKARDPGDLIAEFAAAITADLDPEVAELGDSLDECETQLDADKVFELRRNVTHVRSQSIGYRRFLSPQRAALEKLATLPVDWLADDDRLHLSGAADRAARMAEELESIRERAALTHEALTDLRAEQIDQRGLIISIAAMIFLPLTFLTGLYGMNVKGLWFADKSWAFDAIVGICVLTAVSVTTYFVRQHWLRG